LLFLDKERRQMARNEFNFDAYLNTRKAMFEDAMNFPQNLYYLKREITISEAEEKKNEFLVRMDEILEKDDRTIAENMIKKAIDMASNMDWTNKAELARLTDYLTKAIPRD
jgi:hypothetical protein